MYQLIKQGHLLIATVAVPLKNQQRFEDIDLVFDTGAAVTIIDTAIVDYLGYSAREDAIQVSTLDGAVGRSVGYVIRLPQFRCFGCTLPTFDIACHDMESKLGVSGLLGMNFLRHFRIDMDYDSGKIHRIEPASSFRTE